MSLAASELAQAHKGLKAVVEAELSLIRSNCRRFIRRYVSIFDPDVPGVVIPFRLWPAQEQVLDAFLTKRLVIVLKARQLGLTWLALAYTLWRMLFSPGFTAIAISRREKDAQKLVERVEFMLRHLPGWIVRPVESRTTGMETWEATAAKVVIHHPDGEDSSFEALPTSPDVGRSLTASLLLLDEWAVQEWAEKVWQGVYPSVNRPTGGQVIGVSTGRRGTLFERIWNGAKSGNNGFYPVFLPYHADPRRTPEWRAATIANMVNGRQEYPETEADAFSAGEGAAFPQWDERIHVFGDANWYPGPGVNWRLYRAYDPGFMTRACCKWYAVHPDGWAVCYREYYPTQVVDAIQAEDIRQMSRTPDGKPERIAMTIAGRDAWNKKSDTGKCTADIFAEHGIPLTPADTDRANGWRRLREWLQPLEGPDGQMMARLRFTRACPNTIRVYPAATQDENDPEEVDFDEDHPLDCDRYFVMSGPRPAREEKNVHRPHSAAIKPLSPITGY